MTLNAMARDKKGKGKGAKPSTKGGVFPGNLFGKDAPPTGPAGHKALASKSRGKQAKMTPDPGAQLTKIPRPASAPKPKRPKK